MKIVINDCYGGFVLSHKAVMAYYSRKGKQIYCYDHHHRHINPETAEWYFIFYVSEYLGEVCASKDINKHFLSDSDMPRNDPDLIAVVEELGEAANTQVSKLKIVEIPDDVEWEIAEHDGNEWVSEKHRTWS